uniref:Dpy-19 like C-mannosyltransferase 3 n=1 Tax=Cyprinus carpio carpio TaxID=630221 RepID=A0A8C1H3C7_CYPCA
MTSLRQRKGSKGKDPGPSVQNLKPDCTAEPRERFATGGFSWWTILCVMTGSTVGISLGLLCCIYVATLHENDLWFSNIKEVEREISFRTECGLYYSYYKQMLKAPSIQQGLYELIHDNTTESKRTINILQRMNIYQEVFLSILYRILPIQTYLEPIYFYIYTVFALQTVYVIALFITSWLLSDSWLAGALSGVWYILNRVDTTRVEFTISLRENWSIPFFALQVAAITCYLRPQLKPIHQRVILWLVFVSTFCFCLTWQFNQFVLLVQALIIFTLDCLDFLTTEQVVSLYLMQVLSLLLVWLLQFCNSMILGSLVLSFIVSALFIKHFQKILQLKSDEHIFKFIKAKFGFGATRDFDASLYLCEEAFGLLPLDTFERLAGTVLLYPYLCTLSVLFILLLLVALSNLSTNGSGQASKEKEDRTFRMRPDVAYNLLHTVFFGLLAFSTMRMKYLWTGHMCPFAAFGVCGKEVWSLYLRVLHCNTKTMMRLIRYSVPIVILAFLYYKFWPRLMEEISELREFYDPDTVELMEWIRLKTPKRAVFAGSMQLLAGIKLCTGRVLTNHPHYEDQALRERTRQVYQIYARQSAEEVHKVLCSVGADYIVLEDSICYERRHSRGCRLRDLLDLANGHIMDGPGENEPDLILATHPRFCEAIKTDMTPYSTLFTRVFKNKTFHVYKLKKLKKKNKAENGP